MLEKSEIPFVTLMSKRLMETKGVLLKRGVKLVAKGGDQRAIHLARVEAAPAA